MNQQLWISHSAISAFERCPQAYYYQYQYKNPKTGNRIQTVNPYFSLGLAVHQTIEELGGLTVKERINLPLKERFNTIWENYSGRQGGFLSHKREEKFKKRGERMIEKVVQSNFLEKPSLQMKEKIPNIDLIPDKNIKLVGSLDWIQVLPDNSLHIIDFKTGKNKEKNGSLQLSIYNILANAKLDQKIKRLSYWYLENDNNPTPKKLGSIKKDMATIKEKALEITRSVENNDYPCPYNGHCFACGDFKKIFAGEAEFLGTFNGRDQYLVLNEKDIIQKLFDEEVFDQKEERLFELRTGGLRLQDAAKILHLSEDKVKKIALSIKKKLVKNLTQKELKILIEKKL